MVPRHVFLALLAACTGPAPTVDTDSPPLTDSGETPAVPYFEGDALEWRQDLGVSLAVLDGHPLTVAVSLNSRIVHDWVTPASAVILRIDLVERTALIIGQARHDPQGPPLSPFEVVNVGDVTGDGEVDLAVTSEPHRLLTGPTWAWEDRIDLGPMVASQGSIAACDAGGDGLNDLCTQHGVFVNPVIDGTPEGTWGLGGGGPPRRPIAGRLQGQNVLFFIADPAATGRALFALQPGVSGETVIDGPAYVEEAFSPSKWVPLDLDGDGTDALVVCGTQDSAWSLRLLDPFPVEATVSVALPGRCDALEVADFDGDGDPELAVGAGARVLVVDPVTWTVLAEHVGDVQPLDDDFGFALDSADLNEDGRADLVVGAPLAGRIYFLTDVLP